MVDFKFCKNCGRNVTLNGQLCARCGADLSEQQVVRSSRGPTATQLQAARTSKEWRDKGDALAKSGRFQEAIQCFDNALKIDPNDVRAASGKAITVVKSGGRVVFTDSGAAPTQQELTAKEWCDKGTAFVASNRRTEAIQCFDKALAIDPKNAMALAFKGALAKRELRRNQEALPYCDKALAIDPKNKAAQYLNSMSASK